MTLELDYEDDMLVVYLSKTFTIEEQQAFQDAVLDNASDEQVNVLSIIMSDFNGWSEDGDWEDVTFQENIDPFIRRMAVVCKENWKDAAALYTLRGLREFPIEIFETDEEDMARAWLNSD